MYLLGIDENGLGLTNQVMLGPLLVCAVGFEFEGSSFPIKIPFSFKEKIKVDDSKNIFKAKQINTYKIGETTALSFISFLKGKNLVDFDRDIFKEFNLLNNPCNLSGFCFSNPLKIPVWADSLEDIDDFLKEKKIRFIYFKFCFLCPKLLYKKDKYQKEAEAILKIILDWQNFINTKDYKVYCGKIKNFSKQTVKSWFKEEGFLLDDNIEFITKGDKKEFVIALSSIVGKYIREIFIKRINDYFFQYNKNIPFCCGYRQNKKFDEFIEKIKPICQRNNIELSCLLRDYPLV